MHKDSLKNDINYVELNFESRDAWRLARRIGGSDLATIMGVGRWETPGDIYTRLIYPDRAKSKNLDNNSRVQNGVKAEPHIRALWAIAHPEHKIINPPENNWLFVRKDNDFISVSPDGLSEGYVCGLEIKYLVVYSNKDLEKWRNGNIDPQYFYQVMQYFIVINTLTKVYLVVRIQVMKGETLDHIEEFEYLFQRKEFKQTIKECYLIETAFIDKYIKTHTRPNANYLEEIKKELKL